MEYIKLHIKSTMVEDSARRKAIVRNIESTTDRTDVNELPVMLNVLSAATDMMLESKGFPYKFNLILG